MDSPIDFAATAGVVSGVAAAITAWQSESGANRKINRYTNAVVALQNREYSRSREADVDRKPVAAHAASIPSKIVSIDNNDHSSTQ